MLVTLVGLAIVVAAAIFVAWPMLVPARVPEDVPTTGAGDAVAALVHEKDSALAAIRDADFDHSLGKLSDADHLALRSELETRALHAIAALDEGTARAATGARSGATEISRRPVVAAAKPLKDTAPERFCTSCRRPAAASARFCAGCGRRLSSSATAERRRA